jgi:hypothetical protein
MNHCAARSIACRTPYFKTITVERELATPRRTDSYDIGISGGVVSGFAARGNDDPTDTPRSTYSLEWFGAQLLFTNASYSGKTKSSGPYTEHSELWTFEPRGRLVIRTSDESSEHAHTTITVRYRKHR